jgi:octaprenyl-diphosphate synthase
MTQRLDPVATAPPPAVHPAELLRHELAAVEMLLEDCSRSEVELLAEAARHILTAGGKRFRPQLTLLAARAFAPEAAPAVPVAAALELIHTATLVHDDIVDESDSRRGRATANAFWGNAASVLMGDYLVMKAFALVAEIGDPRLIRLLCDTISRMCEGEVLQICVRSDAGLDIDTYLQIIEAKTGILMATCCRTGALLGGAALEQIEALTAFGTRVGVAFQIVDDVLDYTGEEGSLGKPIGSDLREGKVTLPLIYALQRARPAERQAIARTLERPSALQRADVEAVVRVIVACDGFAAARERAAQLVHAARRELKMIPAGPPRDGLAYLAAKAVERTA